VLSGNAGHRGSEGVPVHHLPSSQFHDHAEPEPAGQSRTVNPVFLVHDTFRQIRLASYAPANRKTETP
jgi:hypothetical protein